MVGQVDSQGAKTMTANGSSLEEVKKHIGDRIRTLRKEKRITGIQLAQACGIPYPQLTHIEKGESELQLEELIKIAHGLHTTAAELLDGIC